MFNKLLTSFCKRPVPVTKWFIPLKTQKVSPSSFFILVQIYLTNVLQFGLKNSACTLGWKGWDKMKANLAIYLWNSCLKEYIMASLLTMGFRLKQNKTGMLRVVCPAPKPLWYFRVNNKLSTLYQRAIIALLNTTKIIWILSISPFSIDTAWM